MCWDRWVPPTCSASLEVFLCFSLQPFRFDAAVFMSHLVTQMAIRLQRWCCVPYQEVQSLKMFIAVGHHLWRQRSAVTVRSDFWLNCDNATKPVAAAQLSLFVVLQKWSNASNYREQLVMVWVCAHQRRHSRMESVNTATSSPLSLCSVFKDPRGPLSPLRVNKPKLCLLPICSHIYENEALEPKLSGGWMGCMAQRACVKLLNYSCLSLGHNVN